MKLMPIPEDKYDEYRLDAIFNCYKWDPQFLDDNTLAKHVLIISEDEHKVLRELTENLDRETVQAEQIINNNLELAGPLALPRKIRRQLKRLKNYQADRHIRLMRYDFHPTAEGGWVVSEVNSDVPGGFAEASLLPEAAARLFPDKQYRYINFGEALAGQIALKVRPAGTIALVHCTSYSDDRQVMQYLGDRLRHAGFHIIYMAADHLRFENKEAVSILDGNEGKIDAIFRFTPVEWLMEMKKEWWEGYFDTVTPSCNHPVAVFAQTKRFPLIWDALEARGLSFVTWRQLHPETIEVKHAKNREGFIYKPAYGRVGEKISIKEACRDSEYENIMKDVKRHPGKYLAQKRFNSRPLVSEMGEKFHVCLGAYCVNGRAAGYYARISRTPRIDSHAADIPVLIERKCMK